MSYSISCVLLIPVTLKSNANTIIQSYGFGPNNLSVIATKTADASSWFGCHIWCDQAFIDFMQSHQAVDFLGTLIISTNAGPPSVHWSSALQANGMVEAPGQ